jgi:hypothetical protein
MSERMRELWREDPALVIMIWVSRYVSAVGCAFTVYVAFNGIPFVGVASLPLAAIHVATWLAWRKD